MIRHTPHGRGHAYRPSLDQRVPVIPLVGEVVEVRALVGDGDPDPVLEVRTDAGMTTLPMGPAVPAAGGETGEAGEDDGHLAAAAAAGEQVEGMRPVVARLDALEGEVAYRITAADARVRCRLVKGGALARRLESAPPHSDTSLPLLYPFLSSNRLGLL